MKFRFKLIAVAVFLAGIFMWGRHSKHDGTVPLPAAVLPKDDNEQIIVDPHHHSLIIINPTGNRTINLPDHPTVIDFKKDGSVKVTSPQWGLERRFFFGIQGSDAFRLAAGMDAFYFKRLDVGVGVASQMGGHHTPIAFLQASYVVWSNCRVGLTYGTDRRVGAALSVRL